MIRFDQVTKVFGSGRTRVRALHEVTLQVPSGAFWSVMGPSGSGKSTVLHLITGLTPPTSGHVFVDEVDVSTLDLEASAVLRRRKVGYIFQSFSLLPYLTVEENVRLPLVLDGLPIHVARERVERVLGLVELSGRRDHKPSELSGGEQQRVAIARAVVIDPSVLLADEPTGNLDSATGQLIMELISRMHEELRVTVLLVTHDTTCAAYAQYLLRLVDGRITEEIDLAGAGVHTLLPVRQTGSC